MGYMDIPSSTEPNGKTVVLMHGNAFGCYYFRNVIEALTGAGYRVVAPDQIGWGKSAKPDIHMTAVPASPPQSAGWCTATASVYNAERDWNNVYVNSNQPYQEATASADGYSWSYQTNGSGFALVYLNGPPPGAQITVTVGGATCTTSD